MTVPSNKVIKYNRYGNNILKHLAITSIMKWKLCLSTNDVLIKSKGILGWCSSRTVSRRATATTRIKKQVKSQTFTSDVTQEPPCTETTSRSGMRDSVMNLDKAETASRLPSTDPYQSLISATRFPVLSQKVSSKLLWCPSWVENWCWQSVNAPCM